jgi:hypothetical protein
MSSPDSLPPRTDDRERITADDELDFFKVVGDLARIAKGYAETNHIPPHQLATALKEVVKRINNYR